MSRNKKIAYLILEAFAYGFFGAVFVMVVDIVKFSLAQTSCSPNFSCDGYVGRGIPLGGVFTGAVLSVILVNFLFYKIIKSKFAKWFLIQTAASITAILLQTIYFISKTDLTFEQIISSSSIKGIASKLLAPDLMIEVFLILTPFTILFVNRWLIIEKIKSGNALK